MNEAEDKIFFNAAKMCEGVITREVIEKLIIEDKTNTLKKYLCSFGMTQFAHKISQIVKASGKSPLVIAINEMADIRRTRPKIKLPKNTSTEENIFNYVPYGSKPKKPIIKPIKFKPDF